MTLLSTVTERLDFAKSWFLKQNQTNQILIGSLAGTCAFITALKALNSLSRGATNNTNNDTNDGLLGNPNGNGIEIGNKSTIMDEINKCINCDSNPDLEIILADAQLKTNTSFIQTIGSYFGRFGHICVRYRIPNESNDKNDIIMNIVGLKDHSMVNFLDPTEYFFGINKFNNGNEQGGIYNRHFYGLRIEKLNDNNLLTLNSYYRAIEHQSNLADVSKFRLVGGRIGSLIKYIPFIYDLLGKFNSNRNNFNNNFNIGNEGNCAMHTSNGLEFAGLIPRKRIFPKAILVDMFEREMLINPNNVHLIEYKEISKNNIKECYKLYPNYYCAPAIVNPIALLRSLRYYNLSKMCDAKVYVKKIKLKNDKNDENNVKYVYNGIVEKNNNVHRPSVSFWIRNTNSFGAIIATLYVLFMKKPELNVEYRALIAAFIVIVHYWIY